MNRYEIIQQIKMVRSDLTEQQIKVNISKLTKITTISFNEYLTDCLEKAQAGEPMPWE